MVGGLFLICLLIVLGIVFTVTERFSLVRQDHVIYRQCEEGTIPVSRNKCCAVDKATGKCMGDICTTDRRDWLNYPLCKKSDKGSIVTTWETFTGSSPLAANAFDLTFGEYLSTAGVNELSLDGIGLPKTELPRLPSKIDYLS